MRKHRFTPAVQRVFAAASQWQSGSDVGWGLPELLLGLLSESESRAARWLRQVGITEEEVHARFPELQYAQEPHHAEAFSTEVAEVIEQVKLRFADLPGPFEFATEHLLFGILLRENEVAQWLLSLGIDRQQVEREAFQRAGIAEPQMGSIPWPLEAEQSAVIALEANQPSLESSPPSTMSEEVGLWRILDAAGNRAREALRVVEDYVRFFSDDRYLSGEFKTFRHTLSEILSALPTENRLLSRETLRDVGTQLSTPQEQRREDVSAVLTANFARLSESLRSLEEFTKLVHPPSSVRLEALRYQSYTLERLIAIQRRSRRSLEGKQLYVLVDGRESAAAFRSLIEQLLAAEVSIIQLRDKQICDRDLVERARILRELSASTSTLFIMNDRADLAMLSGADGLHIGQEELTVKQARQILGPQPLIGVSTHSLAQARQAVADGADYLGIGPTFPSETKSFPELAGLDYVREVTQEIRLPAYAIGGITCDNLPQVLSAGARRVAVASAIINAENPYQAAQGFWKYLRGV